MPEQFLGKDLNSSQGGLDAEQLSGSGSYSESAGSASESSRESDENGITARPLLQEDDGKGKKRHKDGGKADDHRRNELIKSNFERAIQNTHTTKKDVMLADSKQREMKVLNKMLDVMDPEIRQAEKRGPLNKTESRYIFGEMPQSDESTDDSQSEQPGAQKEADPKSKDTEERRMILKIFRELTESPEKLIKAYGIHFTCDDKSHHGAEFIWSKGLMTIDGEQTDDFFCRHCNWKGQYLKKCNMGYLKCSNQQCEVCMCMLCYITNG